MFKRVSAIATIVAIAVGVSVAAMPANASTSSSDRATATIAQPLTTPYSDRDVVAFLSSGIGPIAKKYPDLGKYIPTTSNSHLSSKDVKTLTAFVLSASPKFHERVSVPLQSGDPYAAMHALKAFRATMKVVAVKHGVETGNSMNGDCVVVVAAAVLLVVWAAVKFWGADATTTDDSTRAFAADLATSFSL